MNENGFYLWTKILIKIQIRDKKKFTKNVHGGVIVQGAIFLGSNFPEATSRRQFSCEANFQRQFPGGNFPEREFSGGGNFPGGNFLRDNFPGDIFPGDIFPRPVEDLNTKKKYINKIFVKLCDSNFNFDKFDIIYYNAFC